MIAVGGSTALAWNVSNAASLSLNQGIGTVTGSSFSVSPSASTTYTLTATNPTGSVSASITVSVETQLPVITAFSASPAQMSSGQSSVLSWTVSQAGSLKLGTAVVTGTSATVSPTATTTYTLTATNLVGSVSASVTVTVGTPGSLSWSKTMVYGFGQLIREEDAVQGTTYNQSDQVGSPNWITSGNAVDLGAVVGKAKTLPFGEKLYEFGAKSLRRYTNHERDSDSNAIYMQAREYLAAYGKFAQVDPAYDQTKDDPESWNLYNYVTNNPVMYTDPDGRIAVGVTYSDGKKGIKNLSAEELAKKCWDQAHKDGATKSLSGDGKGHGAEARTAESSTHRYAGTLRIYSQGNGSIDGHSWISFTTPDGDTTTYGTWGNNPRGEGSGLRENLEQDREYDAERSADLDESGAKALKQEILEKKAQGDAAWSADAPCSSFASEAWERSTGEHLESREWLISTPTKLKDSITDANGGTQEGDKYNNSANEPMHSPGGPSSSDPQNCHNSDSSSSSSASGSSSTPGSKRFSGRPMSSSNPISREPSSSDSSL